MKKGFSLIEIMVVVLIVAILGAIAVTQYQTAVDKSRFTALVPTAKALAEAQEMYHMNHGGYANNMSLLETNMEGATGDYATLSNDAIIEIGVEDEYRYVKATRDNLDNNYIVYQSHSQNYPGEMHCEALEGSSRAQKLCKNMGGREISGSLTDGYTTYILRGTGAGIPASFAHEMGEGNFQTCESYPCSKVCARNLPDGYECQGTYQEDHSYSEQVCRDGLCVTTSYDQNGKATSKVVCKQDAETGVCKDVLKKTYDEEGHLLEHSRNCIDYAADGSCKFFRDTVKTTWDEQGNLVSTVVSSLSYWEVYDKDGHLVSSGNQYGSTSNATPNVYDENGRLISKTTQYGSTFTYAYDEEGRLISETNQYGSGTSYTYDEEGRLSTKTQYGSTLTYNYDDEGNLISQVDNRGNTYASYEYDENGRLTTRNQWGSTITYNYDDNGRLISETDQNGRTITGYTYDENGRLINQWTQYGSNIVYAYDAEGGYITGPAGGRTTYNTYDEEGYLVSSTGSDGSIKTYDKDGHLISSKTSYGYTTNYTYDEHGNLTSEVSTNWNGVTSSSTTYTYDEHGNVTSRTYQSGNGTPSTTTYTYDEHGRVTSQTSSSSNYTYTYDDNGNMTSSTYRYGNNTPTITTYTYDENGNKTSQTSRTGNGTPSTTTYTYDENGRLSDRTNSNGSKYTYTYDSNGNITSYNYIDQNGNTLSSNTYAYDEDGHLISSNFGSAYSSSSNYYLDGDATTTIDQTGCVIISYTTNVGSFSYYY